MAQKFAKATANAGDLRPFIVVIAAVDQKLQFHHNDIEKHYK